MDGASHGPPHLHVWQAPDGTGLHAPYGEIVRDEDGAACCHLCGSFYRALGSHVRFHGHTNQSYRAAMGLPRRVALAAPTLSESISRRQKDAYESNPRVRSWMAVGQDMARSGELSDLAVEATAELDQEAVARRKAAAERGRQAQQIRIAAKVSRVRAKSGINVGVPALVTRYQRGESLETLAKAVGIGRQTLRRILLDSGATLRDTGVNTPAGKASRARKADAELAARMGIEDVCTWLADERSKGRSVSDLAALTGHSTHWVRWRIDRAQPSMRSQHDTDATPVRYPKTSAR